MDGVVEIERLQSMQKEDRAGRGVTSYVPEKLRNNEDHILSSKHN
jgi:hypothetical protein